jgi:hypothetical protein
MKGKMKNWQTFGQKAFKYLVLNFKWAEFQVKTFGTGKMGGR